MIKKFKLYESDKYEVEFKKSLKKYIVWFVPGLDTSDTINNILIIEIFDVYSSGNMVIQILYEYSMDYNKIKKLEFEKVLTSEPILLTEKDRVLYQSDNLNDCLVFVKKYSSSIHNSKKFNL